MTASIQSPFPILEAVHRVEDLERHLVEDPDSEELIDQTIEFVNLGLDGLSSEERSFLERDIVEITQDFEKVDEEEPSVETSPVIAESSHAHKKKHHKHHSKGFFKRVARGVAHAVRDTGRAIRHVGGSDKRDLSGRMEKLDLSKQGSSKSHRSGHKVSRFFKKHKKALIIGAVIAALIATGAILVATGVIGTGSAGAVAGGLGLGAGASAKSSQKGRSDEIHPAEVTRAVEQAIPDLATDRRIEDNTFSDNMVEHLGNRNWGSAMREWCDKTKSDAGPIEDNTFSDNMVEHIGNGSVGSAWREWCDKTKSDIDPITGKSRGNNGSGDK
jgi:hypothetical protein